MENEKLSLLSGKPSRLHDYRSPSIRLVSQASGSLWCSGCFLVLSSLCSARDLLIFSSSFKYKEMEAWTGEVTCPKLHGDPAPVSVSPEMALPLPAK